MTVLGKVMIGLAQLAGLVTWLGTAWWLLDDGRNGLALLALLVPPADLVLMFLTPLWPLGVAAAALMGVAVLVGRGH